MTQTKSQTTDTILMIRPAQFGFNTETADTNIFQHEPVATSQHDNHSKALIEFDHFVQRLREHKIYVIVLQDPGMPATPDSLFPNNWISFHEDTVVLYPMLAKNRQLERRAAWIILLKQTFHLKKEIDLSGYEKQEQYLEGTGSLVLDRINKIAYANLSSRTHEIVLQQFAEQFRYDLVHFKATDNQGKEIYHTNVLMAIGEKTAVLCSEVIHDETERNTVLEKMSAYQEVVDITYQQLLQFAGNMLLVKNRDGAKFWVLSEQAFHSLTPFQKKQLEKDGAFIHAPLNTIEKIGGGSARCMMAEVFLGGS
jgi:hypothetical protein